jgi:hypothetical protein
MLSAGSQAGLFVISLTGVSAALAFGLRLAGGSKLAMALQSERLSLPEAARLAYRQAKARRLPIAHIAENQNTPADALAWFEASIRQVVAMRSDAEAAHVTRGELARYMRWARTVQ